MEIYNKTKKRKYELFVNKRTNKQHGYTKNTFRNIVNINKKNKCYSLCNTWF